MKKILFLIIIITSMNLYSQKLNVGVLIYDGVYVLDFTGPIEVFTDTFLERNASAFNVFTISEKSETIKAHSGLQVIPDFTFENAPKIDIFVIPGGNPSLTNDNDALNKLIIKKIDESKFTLSVCTGAFILAKTGKLNGLEATTWHGAIEVLKEKYPKIKVVKSRWTDNGKILTTSGVSAGIDGSLYLVSKIFGKKIANNTANYMDYEYWK